MLELATIRQHKVTLSPSEAYVIGGLGQEIAATLTLAEENIKK